MMAKVLISDKLSDKAREIFKIHGVDVDVKTGLSEEELLKILPEYDGIAVRSATKLRANLIEHAPNLKVVGRAGIGVDNIDVEAATQKGVIVMNTPYGNAITTAEHAIAMMFSLAREIPQANVSTKAGKWEKSKFMGVELTHKTLAVIGCGNIGSIVANRAVGLKMKVVAFDPFLTEERAIEMCVEKVDFETALSRADFITIHTPLNDKTRNLLNADTFKKVKKGARLIHCARGGIVNEQALIEALKDGTLAGAALDVFEVEPAHENPLFELDNVICTPHLGAATSEAQENVAVQIAEQMADFLNNGAISNALNVPSLTAEEALQLKPYLTLAEQLSGLVGQVATSEAYKEIEIICEGALAQYNRKPITSVVLFGLFKQRLAGVNLVNAPMIAKNRNIKVVESKSETAGDYSTRLTVRVQTEKETLSVSGTLFGSQKPRLLTVNEIEVEAELEGNMLFVQNNDKPGFIGALGSVLGQNGINISHFHLGRQEGKDTALALVQVDEAVNDDLIKKIEDLEQCVAVTALSF